MRQFSLSNLKHIFNGTSHVHTVNFHNNAPIAEQKHNSYPLWAHHVH